MKRSIGLTGAILLIASCGGQDAVLDLQPTKNQLVDNLLIATSNGGATAPMGGAVGKFAIKQRCLVINTGGADYTPVFAGHVDLTTSGIQVGPDFIQYGAERPLPMIGAPIAVASLKKSQCPALSIFVRSIGG